MELETRFCTSADGTRIAYAMCGEPVARTLVYLSSIESAQESAWNYPIARAFHEGLASGRRLVTFDSRGVGSSQRDVDDLEIPAQVADLAAVVGELGLESFDLMSGPSGAPLAAAYAAEHPERVGRLVLLQPLMRTSDAPILGRMIKAIRADWPMARRVIAAAGFPTGPTDVQRWFSNMMRDSITPEVYARHFEVIAELDGRTILPSVQARTLVLVMLGARDVETSVQAVASLIPDARLVSHEGDNGTLLADHGQFLSVIHNFLDEADAESEAVESQPAPGGFATILFTDMASSTSMTQELGDAAAQEVRRAHNDIVRSALASNGGNEIKHTGDGIMASFATASSALEAAIAIQRGVAAHKEEHADSPLGVYVGLNAGEPIAEDDDLFGTSINLAARICDHAEAGQILAANVVRELAAGKDFLFSDLDETELRGFEDPIKLWELRWESAD